LDAGVAKMTNQQTARIQINQIVDIVRENGELTNVARSDWGVDTWKWHGIIVGVADAGYTKYIKWGDRLEIWYTYGKDIDYRLGNENEINTLHEGLTLPKPPNKKDAKP
jgi:hypothetical protein